MTHEEEARREMFAVTVQKSMMAMRYLVGISGVCPVCFCDAIISGLEDIRDQYEHNERVEPLSMEQIKGLITDLELMGWKTEGTA